MRHELFCGPGRLKLKLVGPLVLLDIVVRTCVWQHANSKYSLGGAGGEWGSCSLRTSFQLPVGNLSPYPKVCGSGH